MYIMNIRLKAISKYKVMIFMYSKFNKRAKEILRQMTVDEKMAQMNIHNNINCLEELGKIYL